MVWEYEPIKEENKESDEVFIRISLQNSENFLIIKKLVQP